MSQGIRTIQVYSTTFRSAMGPGDICQQLEWAYHVEFNEVLDSNKKTMLVEDTHAFAIAEASVTLDADHYTIDVPFRGPLHLLNNYPQVRAHLCSLR